MKQMILPLVLLFTAATSSFAQEDTWDQAVLSALDGTEPEYIKDIMKELTQKLVEFQRAQNIHSVEQKLALSDAMHAILHVVLFEISTSVKIAVAQYKGDYVGIHAFSITFDSAWSCAMTVLCKGKGLPSDMVLNAVKDAMGQGFRKHVSDKVWETISDAPLDTDIAPVAYRIGEWAGLYWLIANFTKVMRAAFVGARGAIATQVRSTGFDGKIPTQLPDTVTVFLAPCLRHFADVKQRGESSLYGQLREMTLQFERRFK